jgi:hypothetical protein
MRKAKPELHSSEPNYHHCLPRREERERDMKTDAPVIALPPL